METGSIHISAVSEQVRRSDPSGLTAPLVLSVFPHSAIWGFGSIIRRNFSHQNGPQVEELLQDRRHLQM